MMERNDPSRRRVLQTVAATGLSGGFLSGQVAGDDDATGDDVGTQDVEMNDLEYQLDYDIDRFDGQNVSNSGGVRYEQKKYAADSSFFTWQSGTWVNAADDSRDSNWAGNIYAPGSYNSRVTLEISGSTSTNLVFGQCYAYTEDEDDDDFPEAAWAEYAFDVAWDIIDEATPFWVPPRPPSIEQDSNETSIDDGPDGAFIEYYDPSPPMEDEYTATHSADWRWDSSGPVEPGWNFVRANREVEVGEWMWDDINGWMFEKQREHQLALGTGFCIYTEDETTCETDDCDPCMSTDSSTQRLQDCCQLETVEYPIPVSSEHLQVARSRARNTVEPDSRDSTSRFEQQAVLGFEKGPEMDHRSLELIAYRSATAHARGADARSGVLDGTINPTNVDRHVARTIDDVERIHDRIEYIGESLDEVVAKAGQIEKRLVSALAWTKSALEAFELDYMSAGEQSKYGTSAIEFAHGNLEDAELYRETARNVRTASTKRTRDVEDLHSTLAIRVSNELETVGDVADDHTEYVVRNVNSYLDRAERRSDDGYLATAVVDLFYAYTYLEAIDYLKSAKFGQVGEQTLELEQELASDQFNEAAEDAGDIERHLLNVARLEYNTGVEAFGTFLATNDESHANDAYRYFLVTKAMVDAATGIPEEFDLN